MIKILRSQNRKRFKSIISQGCCCFSDKPTENASNIEKLPDNNESSNELVKGNPKSKPLYNPHEPKKEDLVWRSPVPRDLNYYEGLRMFYKQGNDVSIVKWLQQPIDLTPSAIKKWWMNKNDAFEVQLQQYNPARHGILGPELACAHFVVARGGAVKFHNDNKWIKAKDGDYTLLPSQYEKGMYLEAIDCCGIGLRYEGLSNLRDLRQVEWLSLRGCKYMDDFCMDTITNIFSHSLQYLDLRDCYGISERGLGAIYKMPNLRFLYLDDLLKDTKYELTCLLLEELNPELVIKSDVVTFER